MMNNDQKINMPPFDGLVQEINRGLSLVKNGNHIEADELFNMILKGLHTLRGDVLSNIASLQTMTGNTELAKKILKDLLIDSSLHGGYRVEQIKRHLEAIENVQLTQPKIPSGFSNYVSRYQSLFFIHIPKTGGKFIFESALAHELGNKIHYIGHPVCTSIAPDLKGFRRAYLESCCDLKEFQKSLVFTVIRNPFDYLVSLFTYGFPYVRSYMEQDPWASSFGWPFKDFGDFIKAYCDPEYPWMIKPLHECLYFQLFDDSHTSACHLALRTESLAEGLVILCNAFGMSPVKLTERINYSRKGGSRDYRNYYTDELRELVEKKCEWELSTFGYTYDGPDERTILDISTVSYKNRCTPQ